MRPEINPVTAEQTGAGVIASPASSSEYPQIPVRKSGHTSQIDWPIIDRKTLANDAVHTLRTLNSRRSSSGAL